jgi:hypothetical protein
MPLVACEGANRGGGQFSSNEQEVLVEDCANPCPEIDLQPVGTIGDSADEVLPRLMTQLAAGPGYVAAGRLAEPGLVGLYDGGGRMIEVVGRFGAGPGEFRQPVPFPGPDGKLWIVDISNQRITELNASRGQERAFPMLGAIHIAEPLSSGRMLLGGILGGDSRPAERSDTRPPPYYITDGDLEVQYSFGQWQRDGAVAPLNITAGADGHLYQSGGQVYSALELTATGEPVRRYVRRADWFKPGDNEEPDVNRPTFWHLHVDGERRLWAAVMVPAGEYEAAFDGSGSQGYSVQSFDRIRDSVIEVWDLDAGRVIAYSRLPQSNVGFVRGSDQIFTVRQDSLGYVYFDLWHADLDK